MDNKHFNIAIVVAFTIFVIFAGITIHSIRDMGQSNYQEDMVNSQVSTGIPVMTSDGAIDEKKKIEPFNVPSSNLSDEGALKIKFQKYIFDFINLLYDGEYEEAYGRLDKEYVETFRLYRDEFISTYTEVNEYKHFRVLNDVVLEDRYILKMRFFQSPSNESVYTDKIFTVFLEDGLVTYADRGIFSSQETDILVETEEIEVSISKIFWDYHGDFYEMYFLNKTEEQLEIKGIHGVNAGWNVSHEIINGNFINYELRSMFPRKNLVFFRNEDQLEFIEIELSNGSIVTIEL